MFWFLNASKTVYRQSIIPHDSDLNQHLLFHEKIKTRSVLNREKPGPLCLF